MKADLLTETPDIADIAGLEKAKEALLIAAAGRHRLLLIGSPGSGRTLLARRMQTILPPLTGEQIEFLDRAYNWTPTGRVRSSVAVTEPPFRSPHHTISARGLAGSPVSMGEAQLATHGILFLDELARFGELAIRRLAAELRARPSLWLVAAAEPCPCGYAGHSTRRCGCPSEVVADYRDRLHKYTSELGIEMLVCVQSVDVRTLHETGPRATSTDWRERVERVRAKQTADAAVEFSDRMTPTPYACELLSEYGGALTLRNVARTLADLTDATKIQGQHIDSAFRFIVKSIS